jgi:hypothetical protein
MPRYDIHFQPVTPASDIVGYKMFTFGFTAALGVRGPQALVNRWAKTFVTPKGSDLLHPSYGTQFGNMFGSNIEDFSSLQDIVIMAIDDANEQVVAQDASGLMDADESLANATLGWLTLLPEGDGFDVGVVITNKANKNLTLRLALMATR